jgi:hypothetical protein
MAHIRRFGRRIPVPSTLAISRDLRALLADEKAVERDTDLVRPPSISPNDRAPIEALPDHAN